MTSPVITVRPDASIKDAARVLLRNEIAAAPVVTLAGELVGIVSEVDLLRGEISADPIAHAWPASAPGEPPARVSDVMTRAVVSLPEDADAADVADVLWRAGVKSVPVVRGRDLVGIVARRDLLRTIARDDDEVRQDVIRRLQTYTGLQPIPDVGVDQGVVTLRFDGSGSNDGIDARVAELLAQSVPGAVRVHRSAPGEETGP
jgi:predicted transcriptional regulator